MSAILSKYERMSAWSAYTLGETRRAMLQIITDKTNEATGSGCTLAIATFAKLLGISDRMVQKHLAWLDANGVISIIRSRGGVGVGHQIWVAEPGERTKVEPRNTGQKRQAARHNGEPQRFTVVRNGTVNSESRNGEPNGHETVNSYGSPDTLETLGGPPNGAPLYGHPPRFRVVGDQTPAPTDPSCRVENTEAASDATPGGVADAPVRAEDPMDWFDAPFDEEDETDDLEEDVSDLFAPVSDFTPEELEADLLRRQEEDEDDIPIPVTPPEDVADNLQRLRAGLPYDKHQRPIFVPASDGSAYGMLTCERRRADYVGRLVDHALPLGRGPRRVSYWARTLDALKSSLAREARTKTETDFGLRRLSLEISAEIVRREDRVALEIRKASA